MKLKLKNPQTILDSLKELETAYIEYQPVLSHMAAHIEQQLDAIADMKKDIAAEQPTEGRNETL